MEETEEDYQSKLEVLYQNISILFNKLNDPQFDKNRAAQDEDSDEDNVHYDDKSNAWMYILFVLTFYAFSIVVLMVKYIRREREGAKLEFYYNEFVKRDWYKDKNLYDSTGRRIYFTVDGSKVVKKPSGLYSQDPDEIRDMVENDNVEQDPSKKSVVLVSRFNDFKKFSNFLKHFLSHKNICLQIRLKKSSLQDTISL